MLSRIAKPSKRVKECSSSSRPQTPLSAYPVSTGPYAATSYTMTYPNAPNLYTSSDFYQLESIEQGYRPQMSTMDPAQMYSSADYHAWYQGYPNDSLVSDYHKNEQSYDSHSYHIQDWVKKVESTHPVTGEDQQMILAPSYENIQERQITKRENDDENDHKPLKKRVPLEKYADDRPSTSSPEENDVKPPAMPHNTYVRSDSQKSLQPHPQTGNQKYSNYLPQSMMAYPTSAMTVIPNQEYELQSN